MRLHGRVSAVPVLLRKILLERELKVPPADIDIERAKIEALALGKLLKGTPCTGRQPAPLIAVCQMYYLGNVLSVFLLGSIVVQFNGEGTNNVVRGQGVSPWCAGFFIATCSFSNAGFAPFSSNLVVYQRSIFIPPNLHRT